VLSPEFKGLPGLANVGIIFCGGNVNLDQRYC